MRGCNATGRYAVPPLPKTADDPAEQKPGKDDGQNTDALKIRKNKDE